MRSARSVQHGIATATTLKLKSNFSNESASRSKLRSDQDWDQEKLSVVLKYFWQPDAYASERYINHQETNDQ